MGVAFSPDGKYVLTSGQDAYAKRWDTQTGELQTTYGRRHSQSRVDLIPYMELPIRRMVSTC